MDELEGGSKKPRSPLWAALLVLLCGSVLLREYFDWTGFWSSYWADMAGAGWTYILIRGLFTEPRQNRWTRFFTPHRTVFVVVLTAFAIETAQFFELYEATFDGWDYLAYATIVVPLYVLDLFIDGH